MRFAAEQSIRSSRVTIFAILALALAGIASFDAMPSQEDPEITIRSAQVRASYPGMAPERVEQLITEPLEETIKQLTEVKEIHSSSLNGSSRITVTVHDRYTDLAPIWQDLRTKLEDAASKLPDGTLGPFVNDDYGRVSVATLALTGPEFDAREMRAVARYLRNELGALSLVSRVDLFGIQDERIWLDFEPSKIEQLGLSPSAMIQALVGQNIVAPGGSLSIDGQSLPIEPSGMFESIDDIANVPIEAGGGDVVVYLGDIVNVRRAVVDPPDQPVRFNGRKAVVLGASMISGVPISQFARQFEARLAELRNELPVGMSLDLVTWQPPLVQASIDGAVTNLGQTVLTVLAVVMLFLGFRTGVIVGAIVPLSILGSILAMFVWEVPLHRISIAAIIIALGLLVDNGIVIVEDIGRRLQRGEERLAACVGAAGSLGIPLLSSTITTVLAFMPLYLAENVTGEFVRALSQVVTTTLGASWLLSITVLPAVCYWFLKPSHVSTTNDDAAQQSSRAYRLYARALRVSLRHPGSVLVAIALIIILAFVGLGQVTARLMPASDRSQFVVYLDLPAGADVRETLRVSERLSNWLEDEEASPDVESHVIYVASGGPRFFLALSPPDPASNVAFAVVNTLAEADVDEVMRRIEAHAARALPEARVRAEKLFLGSTPTGTVEVRASGARSEVLGRIAGEIEEAFRDVEGVRHVRNDWENPVIKLQVDIDQDRARLAGVSGEDVARALSAYFDGYHVSDYREGDAVIPIVIRAVRDTHDIDGLRAMTLFSSTTGAPVPLVQIADITGEVEPSQIRRVDQRRTISLRGIHPQMQASELHAAMTPALDAIDLPPGYELDLGGELRASDEANSALFAFMPHCLAGIVMILIVQFNSFRRPFIIFATIPLVVVGGTLALLATGAFLDFVAMLGFFSLAGIIVNNGIVLIERIDLERERGDALSDAIVRAAVARARPILMTTLTTILGLVPLLLFGGEFWRSMALVVMGGLGLATPLSLFLVPSLYALLFRRDAEPAKAEAASG